MNDFLHGALTTASFVIGLFFLRYWRSTSDRLFLMFSAAFSLLGLTWMLGTVARSLALHAYALPLLAFVLIALALLDKNSRKKARE